MGQKVYSQNGVLLGVPVGGSTQNLKAGDGITIDDNYISVDAHTSGNIEGNGTTDNPITLKDTITLGTVTADTVTGVKGNFGDVLIGRSDKVSVFIQKVKDLEAAQHEYAGGDHITITDYVINLDDDVALKSDLPDLTPYALKTSLQDYIKSDALNNYYTKNETYNKNEIIEMLDAREYVGSEHIDITDGVISVKDLANTTVTSNNQTVTVIPTINEDGSTNYDLSVVGGQGGDTNIVGKWPVWSVDNGDGNWLVGADMTEWIKGKDVDEKLTAYQLIMTAGSNNVHIENNQISVDDTVYKGTAPIIVTDKVISFDDSAYATKQALATEVTNRTNADDSLKDEIDDLQEQIDNLPGALTAGDHIDITNGVISVTGIKDHEYTGDEYIIVDNTNDKITLLPKWVDWSTYWSEQLAIKGRATSLEGRMTAVENGKADIGLLNNYYTKSETLNVTEINNLVASKQDKLTAGDHISIVGNTISATGFDSLATKSELTAETNERIAGDNALAEEITEKQDPISAGDHIRIDDGVTINAVGLATSEELTAETNARTSADTTLQNNINGKQDKLTAGDGIKIENNVISVDAGTEDVYNLATGTGITLTKDDTNKEVVIATTGLAAANDLTQEVIDRTNSYSYLEGQLATKQPTLTAGSNITISDDNVISASDSTVVQHIAYPSTSEGVKKVQFDDNSHGGHDIIVTMEDGTTKNKYVVIPEDQDEGYLKYTGYSRFESVDFKNKGGVITPIYFDEYGKPQACSTLPVNPTCFDFKMATTFKSNVGTKGVWNIGPYMSTPYGLQSYRLEWSGIVNTPFPFIVRCIQRTSFRDQSYDTPDHTCQVIYVPEGISTVNFNFITFGIGNNTYGKNCYFEVEPQTTWEGDKSFTVIEQAGEYYPLAYGSTLYTPEVF